MESSSKGGAGVEARDTALRGPEQVLTWAAWGCLQSWGLVAQTPLTFITVSRGPGSTHSNCCPVEFIDCLRHSRNTSFNWILDRSAWQWVLGLLSLKTYIKWHKLVLFLIYRCITILFHQSMYKGQLSDFGQGLGIFSRNATVLTFCLWFELLIRGFWLVQLQPEWQLTTLLLFGQGDPGHLWLHLYRCFWERQTADSERVWIPDRPARDCGTVRGGECEEGVATNGGKPVKSRKAVRFPRFSSSFVESASLEAQIALQRILFHKPACHTEQHWMLAAPLGPQGRDWFPWRNTVQTVDVLSDSSRDLCSGLGQGLFYKSWKHSPVTKHLDWWL